MSSRHEESDGMTADALLLPVAAGAEDSERLSFLRRTYLHVGGALALFLAVEALLLVASRGMEPPPTGPLAWLAILALFALASVIADRWSRSETSIRVQYIGLGVYVLLEAFLFWPLTKLALHDSGVGLLIEALGLALGTFGCLTLVVVLSGLEFTFLRGILAVTGAAAAIYIVLGLLRGFELGLFFALAMCVWSAAAIVVETATVVHRHRLDQHVSAALSLFAAVTLLLWYILVSMINTES